jgi:hypothetical protein
MPSAYARYSNQQFGIACEYTVAWGTQPGIITLTAPAEFLAQNLVDTLTVYFNNSMFLQLTDVLFVTAGKPGSVNGARVRNLTLHDRRWKWQYATPINGYYNHEAADGIALIREKTLQELAALCFDAMGETEVDVTALPSEINPKVSWLAANPAQELEKLLSDYGCALVFDPFQNKPFVRKIGIGQPPPNLPASSKGDAVSYPPNPETIRIYGGPAVFQTALKIFGDVGLDVDGQFKFLKDLSYAPDDAKPYGGFEDFDPDNFEFISTTYTDPFTGETLYHRDLAAGSVWKTKLIVGQMAGGISPQVLKETDLEPTVITDLGPFATGLIEKDARTNEPLPPVLYGTHVAETDGEEKQLTKRYYGSINIDDKKMLLSTSDPLYKRTTEGYIESCDDLALIVAYEVRKDGVPVCYSYSQPTEAEFGFGELAEFHQEIVRKIAETGATWTGEPFDNKDQVDAKLQEYIDAINQRQAVRPAFTRDFPGLQQLTFDGMLREVSWAFSTDSTPATRAAWNTERLPYVTPWEANNRGNFIRLRNSIDFANRLTRGGREGQT